MQVRVKQTSVVLTDPDDERDQPAGPDGFGSVKTYEVPLEECDAIYLAILKWIDEYPSPGLPTEAEGHAAAMHRFRTRVLYEAALDWFGGYVAIGCLEDFEVTVVFDDDEESLVPSTDFTDPMGRPVLSFDPMQVKSGVYRVYWKTGGHSVASVHHAPNGNPMLTPANWCSGSSGEVQTWCNIKRLVPLELCGEVPQDAQAASSGS